MTPIEKIKFSFLCKEDSNKMTPCSLGLHCASCNKTVIDFRKSDLPALTKSLEEHGTICGIFSKSQMHHIKQPSALRQFIASALITIGLGTFNKDLIAQTQASDSLIHKHSIEEETDMFLGVILDTMPTFKNGGEIGLVKFLKENLNYPSDNVQGKVYVGFTIDTTGKTINAKILRGLSEAADKEVLRVVELLEFIPGTKHGKKIQTPYTLPIAFSSDHDKKKK